MDAEKVLVVGPRDIGRPAGSLGQLAEIVDREFIGVFGVDGFAFLEMEWHSGDQCRLGMKAFQMHLNAAGFLVIEGQMREAVEVEGAVQLTVYALQEVEIEGGG